MRLDGERAIAAGGAENPQLDSTTKLPQGTQIDYFTTPRIAEKHKRAVRQEEDKEPIPSLDELLAQSVAAEEKKRRKIPPPLPLEATAEDMTKFAEMEPPPIPVAAKIEADIREVLEKTPGSTRDFGAAIPLTAIPPEMKPLIKRRSKEIGDNNMANMQLHVETVEKVAHLNGLELVLLLQKMYDVELNNDGSAKGWGLSANKKRVEQLKKTEPFFKEITERITTLQKDEPKRESRVSRFFKKLAFWGSVTAGTAASGGALQQQYHEEVGKRGEELAQQLDAENLAKLRLSPEEQRVVKPIDRSFIGFTEKEGMQVEGKNAFTFNVGAPLPGDFARVVKKMHDGKTSIQLDGGIVVSKRTDDKGTDSYFFKDKDNGEVFRAVAVADGRVEGEARWDNDKLTKKVGTTTDLTAGKIAMASGVDKNFTLTSAKTGETITSAFAGATYEPGSAIDFGNKSRVKAESTDQGASPIQLEPQTWQAVETGEMGPAAKVPTLAPAESVTNKFVLENDRDQRAQAKIDAGIKGNTSATESLRDRPVETQAQKADREAHAAKYKKYLEKERDILSGKTVDIPTSDPKTDPEGQLDQLRRMEAFDQLKKAQEELEK